MATLSKAEQQFWPATQLCGNISPSIRTMNLAQCLHVLSISPTNYDLAPALTDKFRKRFGFFMVHEAIESAVTLDVLAQAVERAKSANPKAVTEALHGGRFDGGWTKAMPGGAIQFDQSGLNTLLAPIMVQWRKRELVTVWPKDFAKTSPVWHSH